LASGIIHELDVRRCVLEPGGDQSCFWVRDGAAARQGQGQIAVGEAQRALRLSSATGTSRRCASQQVKAGDPRHVPRGSFRADMRLLGRTGAHFVAPLKPQ
jgi:hypothetical protein